MQAIISIALAPLDLIIIKGHTRLARLLLLALELTTAKHQTLPQVHNNTLVQWKITFLKFKHNIMRNNYVTEFLMIFYYQYT